MAIYNKRIEFTRENLLGHYSKRDSLWDFIYGIVRFFGIIVQNIYCVSSYLVLTWIILYPISWIRSDLYSRVENYLYNSLLFIVSSWSMAAGATVVETGDEFKSLIEQEPGLLVENNHQHVNSIDLQNDLHFNDRDVEVLDSSKCKMRPIPMSGDSNVLTNINNHNSDKKSILTNGIKPIESTEKIYKAEHTNDLNRTKNAQATNKCPNSTIVNNNDDKYVKNLERNDINKPAKVKTNRTESLSISNSKLSSWAFLQPKADKKKPRVLLLCNHISTADVPLMMQSFSTMTNQSLLWVLDAQFKPTNFGLVCISHGDFFIAKDSFADGSLRDHVLRYPDRNILVLFPEGGFWRKRLDGSNRYALRNGLSMTKYVTHPRFGAFKDLIDPSVGVTHIVDATLLYDDIKNPLSILDIAMGNRKEPAILNFKVYERSQINPTEEWLRNIWLDKDKLLQQYYEDRGTVYKRFEGTIRSAKLDWFKVLAVHLFYLLVCYLTIYRLFSATSVTMLKARDLYYSNI